MFYPIMLNLSNKKITIVGGGKVAFRKTKNLLDYSEDIRVISPEFVQEFDEIKDRVDLIISEYDDYLVKDSFIIIAATNIREINKKIEDYCKKNSILCNIVDDRINSDFIVPSVIRRGELSISISTNGRSPSLSKKIRENIEKEYPYYYEGYVNLIGEMRELIMQKCDDIEKRKKLLNELVNLSIPQILVRRNEYNKCSKI